MKEFKFIKNASLSMESLHFQFIPKVFNRAFWPGDEPLLVSNSPHVRFLQTYQKVGRDIGELWKTDYVKMMEYWNSINFHHRDKAFILSKIDRLITLYRSIKKHGYSSKHRIEVLKIPFWESRYSEKTDFVKGYEIWHGHHRAACCYCLGIMSIDCKLIKDEMPGSKKCERIDKRLEKVKL